MMSSGPSLYESYNARFLSPSEVAESFIPPSQYQQLIEPGHSLLVGPRGSGKTSMLKMLQISALREWKHPNAEATRKRITYCSVFIPTDIIWFEQLNALHDAFHDADLENLIIDSAISLHIIRRIIEVMRTRISEVPSGSNFMSVSMNLDIETQFSRYITDECKLDTNVFSLSGVHRSLKRFISRIGQFIAEERIKSTEGRRERFIESNLLITDFRQHSANIVSEFNELVGEPGRKWALCFDELEIAPASLQGKLLNAMRSTDEVFFFKLSMSPYTGRELSIAAPDKRASAGDDFNLIPLWFPEKRDAAQFSNALAREILARSNFSTTEPIEAFDHSLIRDEDEDISYRPGSRNYHIIKSLAQVDSSFSNYLKKRAVNVETMHLMSENERAEKVRKILPIVIHRSYFKRFSENSKTQSQKFRSRKGGDLYCGWESISAICEGNPRWIIGMLKEMITSSPPNAKIVSREIQWAAIKAARGRFRAKLKTFKLTPGNLSDSYTVLGLIDRIGNVFRNELLADRFIAEPPNGFELDQKSNKLFNESIGMAANAGALMLLKQNGYIQPVRTTAGSKFRLCYLLATEYGIPLRMGSYRSLTTILDKEDGGKQLLMVLDE